MEKIKERVTSESLHINRVPPVIKEWFLKFAKEEFDDDFGFALKKIVEVYQGFYPSGNEEIEMKIDILAAKIAELESKQEEKKGITTLSGRRIGGKKNVE